MRLLIRKDLYLTDDKGWITERPKTEDADRRRVKAGCIYKFSHYFGDGMNFDAISRDEVISKNTKEDIRDSCDKPEFIDKELNELIRKRLIDII